MRKSVQNLTVTDNIKLNKDHHLLILHSEQKLQEIAPGQFANILVDKSQSTFLRRPFSIHSVDYNCNSIHILIKGIGEGTKCLSKTAVGEQLSVIFPLGKGFSIPEKRSKVLLVGGGCGVAPMLLLAQTLNESAHNIYILLGARSADDLVELETYTKYGDFYTTTEDGTHGEKGFVTDHHLFDEELQSFDRVYTCGPEPMMKAVALKAKQRGVFCELSLENTMACGFGVCLCCVTETTEGNQCVCTEGPVFNINRLKWQI
jgi:dihydroorotate dehydrogenase electron transfer subunit